MESLSDIVAQMRGRGEDGRVDRHLWNEYADRIEAAAKRERAPVGNAAAMSDALGKIVELAKEWWNHDYDPAITLGLIIDRAVAALAAPARNCDKFVTQPEMSRAYEEYRKSAMKNYGNGLTGRVPTVKQKPMTYDEWLLAPAAERKGEGDAE